MLEIFWSVLDWISVGFCDRLGISSSYHFDSSEKVDRHCSSTNPCVETVWKGALLTGQLNLQKFDMDRSTVDYLMQEVNKLDDDQRLKEIMLVWCNFPLVSDRTEEDVLALIESCSRTLTALRFWKARQGNTIANEILLLLFTSSIPTKLHVLQVLELSYFDLRQHNISQALSNVFTQRNCLLTDVDISYCKTNRDFFLSFMSALKQHKQLEMLGLSGTGIDDNILKIICHGLIQSPCFLRKLHLSHNKLTTACLPSLAIILKQKQKLQELYLQENESLLARCSSVEIEALAMALPHALSLQTLNLACCGLSNSTYVAAVVCQGLKQIPILKELDLSHNQKLNVDLEWLLPLCQCQKLQHLTLPDHMNHETTTLSRVLLQCNISLLELKFPQVKGDPIISLSKPMEDLLRRNQLLCLACTYGSDLPTSLWPRVIVTLFDKQAPGSRTSVYAFLQTCLQG